MGGFVNASGCMVLKCGPCMLAVPVFSNLPGHRRVSFAEEQKRVAMPLHAALLHKEAEGDAELPIRRYGLVDPVPACSLDAPCRPLPSLPSHHTPLPGDDRRGPCSAGEARASAAQLVPEPQCRGLGRRTHWSILFIEHGLPIGFEDLPHHECIRQEAHPAGVGEEIEAHIEQIRKHSVLQTRPGADQANELNQV